MYFIATSEFCTSSLFGVKKTNKFLGFAAFPKYFWLPKYFSDCIIQFCIVLFCFIVALLKPWVS